MGLVNTISAMVIKNRACIKMVCKMDMDFYELMTYL